MTAAGHDYSHYVAEIRNAMDPLWHALQASDRRKAREIVYDMQDNLDSLLEILARDKD